MIAAVTIEAKLITIMLLALMNILLIRRKKPAHDAIETYTLQDQHTNFNISINQQGDDDQLERPDNLTQAQSKTNNNTNSSGEQKPPHSQDEHSHESFFVNTQKPIKPLEQQQQSSSVIDNHIPNANQSTANQLNIILPQLIHQHERIEQIQHREEPVYIQQGHQQAVPMDLQVYFKSDAKSDKQLPIPKELNHRRFFSSPSTQRKFIQPQWFSGNQSQFDSHTKKTQLNHRPKQAPSQYYNHNSTPYNIPKQTFKRCIQQLICNAVEEMVEKDNTNLDIMTKKKKRSQ